jgi:heptosyltransferase-1
MKKLKYRSQIQPDMSQTNRLLIVKLSSIGDVVHALPVSAALGKSFPHLKISWIVEKMAAPVLEGNPYLDEIIVLPAEWRQHRGSIRSLRHFLSLKRDLHSRHFDIALDLQGLSKSALISQASGAMWKYGYDWLRELAPYLETRIPRRPESIHIVDQFLDTALFFGANIESPEFPIRLSDAELESAKHMLIDAKINLERPILVVNPSSGGGGNKGWGADRFANLIDILSSETNMQIVLVGSKGDMNEEQIILSNSAHSPASLVGKTNLRQLIAILKIADIHLCGDTGSAHIAAALGTPVVSLFGRSNPARLAPYGQEKWAIHHRERCHEVCKKMHEHAPINSKQKCLSPPPACLAAITVDEVFNIIQKVYDIMCAGRKT